MAFCPQCGKEIKDADSKFCAGCGRMLSGGSAASGGLGTARKKDGIGAIGAIVVAIVLIAAVGGIAVAAVGGKVDFKTDYDDETFLLVNESKGVFDGYLWTISEEGGGQVYSQKVNDKSTISWDAPEYGVYTVTLTAYSILGMEWASSKEIVEDGFREYTTTWDSYSVTVRIAVSDYYTYKSSNIERWPGSTADKALVDEFMNTDTQNGSFESIIDQLKQNISSLNLTLEQQVNYLMGFVQHLDPDGATYKEDPVLYGADEYWAYPIQTLFKKGGDCEDLAMLMMALSLDFFADAGVNVSAGLALFYPPDVPLGFGHAIAAIYMDGLNPNLGSVPENSRQVLGETFRYYVGNEPSGKQYYACETSNTGFKIGVFGVSSNSSGTEVYYAKHNPSMFIVA